MSSLKIRSTRPIQPDRTPSVRESLPSVLSALELDDGRCRLLRPLINGKASRTVLWLCHRDNIVVLATCSEMGLTIPRSLIYTSHHGDEKDKS
jgi:hypothetical protein